ncbi:hypothetical protein [Salinarimonas rosea]|uniref:hypothetical protein n=1 Tax=Salinarimonas rosea TaxID=552063 RepID=UPI0003FE1B3C|nr:hypothetical protein [Salinarimonas rosea]
MILDHGAVIRRRWRRKGAASASVEAERALVRHGGHAGIGARRPGVVLENAKNPAIGSVEAHVTGSMREIVRLRPA